MNASCAMNARDDDSTVLKLTRDELFDPHGDNPPIVVGGRDDIIEAVG